MKEKKKCTIFPEFTMNIFFSLYSFVWYSPYLNHDRDSFAFFFCLYKFFCEIESIFFNA